MKHYTYEQFTDRTALLPDVIAERVWDRPVTCDAEEAERAAFVEWAGNRTVRLYNHCEDWRKKMHQTRRREVLYAFLEHWRDAWHKMGGAAMRERYPAT